MTNAVQLFQRGWRGLAAVALGAAVGFRASADTAFQGVWSQSNGNCLWTVDEEGNYTFGNWVNGFTDYTGGGWLHDGVIYTPRITDRTTDAQKITVLRNSGGNLPVLSAPGTTEMKDVVVTPDGAWCYVLGNAGLFRYDLSTGTTGTWSLVDAQTTCCPKHLVVDEAGHVFATIRDNGYSYRGGLADIRCYDAATGTKAWEYRFNTTDQNGPTGICWNPADNYIYWTTTARTLFRMPANGDSTKLESYTFSGTGGGDGLGGWGEALAVFNGTFYMNYYNTSSIRITTFVWPLADAVPSNFACKTVDKGSNATGLMIARALPARIWRMATAEPSLIGRNSFRKGAVTPATYGVKSGAGYFASANAFAYLQDSATLLSPSNAFSLIFWVCVPALASAPAVPRHLLSNDVGQNGALSVVADQGAANKVGLVFRDATGALVTLAGGTVADGAWHQIAICRRDATTLELWLDGVKQGAAALDEQDTLAQDANWHFGSNGDASAGLVGTGAALGEIRQYDQALSAGALADFGTWLVYADAPVDPGAPAEADPMPAQFGTQIAHAYAEDAPFGNPGLFIAASGDYYASASKLGAAAMAGQSTTIYRSTDGGATWAAWSMLAASGVTLFEAGGVLYAFGQKDARTFAIWKYADEAWTEAASACAADGDFTMSPGSLSVGASKVLKPVVRSFTPCSNEGRIAWVSFSVDGSTFSNGGVVISEDVNLEWGDPTVKSMLPGHSVFVGGRAQTMNVIERRARNAIPVCADQMFCYAVEFNYQPEKNPCGSLGTFKDFGMFRGGNAPFGLAYDSSAALVRTVSIADGKYVLQASQTGRDWMPCGEIDVPTGGTSYAPAIAIDGDDLVMVTGVRCDDGAGGADLTEGGVYLALKKIAGFRTNYAPEEPDRHSRRFVYSVNERGSVEQVWKASDGRWYQGATFKQMYSSLGGDSLTSPMGVWYAQRHYFLYQAYSPKLHVLDENGTWQKAITLPSSDWWNEVATDKNGQNLTVRLDGHSIQAVDWRAGTCTTVIDTSSADWYKFNQFTVATDGTVYACGSQTTTSPYAYYRVDRIARDGTVSNIVSVYCTTAGWDSFGGIALDEAEENLYFITGKGILRKYNFATGETTQVANYGFSSGSTCLELRYRDGKLVVSGNTGKTMQIDPATGELEPSEFGFVYQVRGMTFAERKASGMILLIK